ncbi:ATPase [Rhodoferax sp. AJA081-3]|uniref:BadF/BadG/BcrA/BcrD ATPase family protein n=1 Tax=Rhodoferax sp. AJA081-3 TaxID=2752316 RepID=UPI001BB79024|nr:BadF/BadG/BcrA/BcrD ATPase family protein [Rhodoferax sp. AJA081-3]QTN30008.1 ATPase [Rhodoferax sp. AJA081-3]
MVKYLLGVDGGGTGTRVVLATRSGTVLALASAGPSALGQGVAAAWRNILAAVHQAFALAELAVPDWSQCALGAGLSGVHHQPWCDAFVATNPGFAHLAVENDAYIALLAAHKGLPGAMVAAGTGSVGEALYADGTRHQVSGWGFPVGDEGSGAWLGLRAMSHAQEVMDRRLPAGPLATQIHQLCGSHRDALQAWCATAGQNEYAQLAPTVFASAASDTAAEALLAEAAAAIERMAAALDPQAVMPLAVCGSVGRQLLPRLAGATRARAIASPQDAVHGALTLVHQSLE